ncbi:YdiK family protein [Anaerobacillus sp. HL2]|nr:YdiK family protein [Anaerobacillus sp. HL2]
MIYLFWSCSFVYFAIQQNKRTDQWDFLTIALMALASYDLIVAYRHFTYKVGLKINNPPRQTFKPLHKKTESSQTFGFFMFHISHGV